MNSAISNSGCDKNDDYTGSYGSTQYTGILSRISRLGFQTFRPWMATFGRDGPRRASGTTAAVRCCPPADRNGERSGRGPVRADVAARVILSSSAIRDDGDESFLLRSR